MLTGSQPKRPGHTVIAAVTCIALALVMARGDAAAAGGAPQPGSAMPPTREQAGEILLRMARARFGKLTRAETILVRAAPQRLLASAGPSRRPNDPANDPHHADRWGPERTIRAELLVWLASSAESAPYLHPSGPGILGARIVGRLDFSYQILTRPLTLIECSIPGGIDLSYARLQSLDIRSSVTGPITADIATVANDFDLQFGDYGPLSLYRTNIGGSLDLSGSRFQVGGGSSVSAIEASIGGDAIFHQGFTTDGVLDFRLARIGHALSISGARFVGDHRNGLVAERAVISGPLYWDHLTLNKHTVLDLLDARAALLWDDEQSWPHSGNLLIDDFTYDGFGTDSPVRAPLRLKWLELQPHGYGPQPYAELARALRHQGRVQGAVDVMIAERVALRRYGHLNRMERVWNFILQVTIGYGFEPLRALWWMGGFVLLGAAAFGVGYRMRAITPTHEAAYQRFIETGTVPSHYPPFNPLVYSLENFLPLVELHQGEYWRPNSHRPPAEMDPEREPRPEMGRVLRWYLWVHILAGWILTPLLAAGLSGLIHVA